MHKLPIDILLRLENLFSEKGLLAEKYSFQRRKSQAQMHQILYDAFSLGKGAFLEAPTGTGKTFGYLFPACEYISFMKTKGTNLKVVISTASKSLQDQLLFKDFTLLKEVYPNIKSAVWKGANNYLCMNRFESLLTKEKGRLLGEARMLYDYKDELNKMQYGLRDELPIKITDELWFSISGQSPCCNTKDEHICYKRKAFLEAKDSDILCINHTLLTFMALYAQLVHPSRPKPDDLLLIVDEAHELIPQIQGAINKNFSLFVIKNLINQITGPEKASLLGKFEIVLGRLLKSIPIDAIEVTPKTPVLVETLTDLASIMYKTASALKADYEALVKNDFILDDKEKQEARATYSSLLTNAQHLNEFLTTFPADQMLEVAKDLSKKSATSQIRINFFPFTFDQELDHIYSFSSFPPIFTSATLFNTSKNHLLRKYNLNEEQMIIKQISAEFDYLTTIKGYCFPNIDDPTNPSVLTEWLKPCIDMTHGNALILFTNTLIMKETFFLMRHWGDKKGYNMMIQGQDGDSIQKLIQKLQTQHNSVLFGVASLWTGNDIKGANLSNLIITKLPFRAQDNFAQSFSRFLAEQGLNPFYDWVLPEMISTFRQGLGRLKRDETDKGLVFILDPRFIKARYKPYLVGRLPLLTWHQIHSLEDFPKEDLTSWLNVYKPEIPTEDKLSNENLDF